MRKLVMIFTGLVLVAATVQAQQITGVVKDPQGKGLDKTTVSLLKAKDSSVVKLVVTSDKGRYTVLLRKPAVIWSVLHMWVFKQRIHSLLNCRVQVLPFPILRFPRQKEI